MKKTKLFISICLLIFSVLDFVAMGFNVNSDIQFATEIFGCGIMDLIIGIIYFLIYRSDLKAYKRYTASLGPDANIDLDVGYLSYTYTEDYKIEAILGLITFIICIIIAAFVVDKLIYLLPLINIAFYIFITAIRYIEIGKKMD